MMSKFYIFIILLLFNTSTILFAQNTFINDFQSFSVETKKWPHFKMFIHLNNLKNYTPENVSKWKIKVNFGGKECRVLNAGQFSKMFNQPNHVLLIIDNSSSMKPNIEYTNQAYKIFMDGLRENSYVTLVSFHKPTSSNILGSRLLAQYSNSFYFLKDINIFSRMTQRTYLWDATYQSVVFFDDYIKDFQRSIVILSDGRDVGSHIRFEKLRKRAVDSGIPIYFIDFSKPGNRNKDAYQICKSTNGFYAASSDPKKLADIYFTILGKINNQISLDCQFPSVSYKSPPESEINISIFDGKEKIKGKKYFRISHERADEIKYFSKLRDITDFSLLPTDRKLKKWKTYQDACWFELGVASIMQKKWKITDKAIHSLENSQEIFSLERAQQLKILKNRVQENSQTTLLINDFINDFYSSPLIDENIWKLVRWDIFQEKEKDAKFWSHKLVNKYPWSRYSDDALSYLASLEIKNGDFFKAEKFYKDIILYYNEGDMFGQTLLELSKLYVNQNEIGKAERILLENIDKFQILDLGGQLYYQLASIQAFHQNKYLQAVKSIDRYLKLKSVSSGVSKIKLLKADIYWKNLFLFGKAKDIYKNLLNSKNINSEIRMQVQSRYEQLLTSTTPKYQLKLLEKKPNEEILIQIMKKNNWSIGKELPEKFLLLAKSFMNNKEYDKAVQITQAVARDYKILGVKDRALYIASKIYGNQGKYIEQSKTLESLLTQYPGSILSIPARRSLAESYLEQGNQKDALTTYEELLSQIDTNYYELASIKSEYINLVKSARVFIKGKLKGSLINDYSDMKIIIHQLPSSKIIATTKPDRYGNYSIDLLLGKQYTLIVEASGYLPLIKNLDYRNVISSKNIQEKLKLKLTKAGQIVTLENILFDFNSSRLRSESYAALNEMVRFVKNNPDREIEISGHTDDIGGLKFNLKLSLNRALSVARYLLENGCSLKNVITKGYAYTKPVATQKTEEGRAKNRRVELKVLK